MLKKSVKDKCTHASCGQNGHTDTKEHNCWIYCKARKAITNTTIINSSQGRTKETGNQRQMTSI